MTHTHAEACYHCGEDIPKGFDAPLVIEGETRNFCCYGCQAIAGTIVDGGLQNFYKHRTQAASKAEEFSGAQRDELKLFDDSALQADFVTEHDVFSEAQLSISGITCAACIWLLEKEISQQTGVERFSINHTTHKAILLWNPAVAKLSDLLIRVREIGYKAYPYREDTARQLAAKEKRTAMFRIAVAGIATMQNMMFSVPIYLGIYDGIDNDLIGFFRWVSLLMSLPVILFAATPFFRAAIRDLKTRHLTMDVPVSIAILGAFFSSAYITLFEPVSPENEVYFDSVAMFTFFLLLGRFLEMQTRHKHLNSDADMARLLPTTAIILEDGKESSIPSHKLKVDDVLVIRQGQTIPADGIVTLGQSRVDESALTGEFLPVDKKLGSSVSGGTANIENTLHIQVTATPKQSRVASIIKLLDQAQSEKPLTVQTADKIASYFVGAILLSSIAVGTIWYIQDPDQVFAIVLSVLVATCPCALSLATPTALTSANTYLREKGFLIAKSHAMEAMTEVTDIIFDKTGTLTKGELTIESVKLFGTHSEDEVLAIAAALEEHSSHPVAQSFAPYFQYSATKVISHLGKGISGEISEKEYALGNRKLIPPSDKDLQELTKHKGLSLLLSCDGKLIAQILLNDSLREDSIASVKAFKAAGIRPHILSGDTLDSVERIANELGIEQFKAECSPENKLEYVKSLQAQGRQITMVGDGINDLPVLSGAKLSIAMGQASDIAKFNSDAILLNNRMSILNEAFSRALTTRRVIKQNISWAAIYNLTMLPLAAMGWVPPYFAALGMSLSSLMVVFNSLRLRKRLNKQLSATA